MRLRAAHDNIARSPVRGAIEPAWSHSVCQLREDDALLGEGGPGGYRSPIAVRTKMGHHDWPRSPLRGSFRIRDDKRRSIIPTDHANTQGGDVREPQQ
jgi:hypothetical protein